MLIYDNNSYHCVLTTSHVCVPALSLQTWTHSEHSTAAWGRCYCMKEIGTPSLGLTWEGWQRKDRKMSNFDKHPLCTKHSIHIITLNRALTIQRKCHLQLTCVKTVAQWGWITSQGHPACKWLQNAPGSIARKICFSLTTRSWPNPLRLQEFGRACWSLRPAWLCSEGGKRVWLGTLISLYQSQLLSSRGVVHLQLPNPAFDFGNKTRESHQLCKAVQTDPTSPSSLVTLGRLLQLLKPQFPYLWSGVYNAHLYGGFMRLEVIFAKHLALSSLKEVFFYS